MSLSGYGELKQFPKKAAGFERAGEHKLAQATEFEDIIEALEIMESSKETNDKLQLDELIEQLSQLMLELDDPATMSKSQTYSLYDFTPKYGIQRAIGRVMRAKGYNVNEAVFEDSEPPQAS